LGVHQLFVDVWDSFLMGGQKRCCKIFWELIIRGYKNKGKRSEYIYEIFEIRTLDIINFLKNLNFDL
jgi:hypothetical protein